ncbi:hypothetical protein F4W70_26775 [Pseudomonas cannabina]|nr:hypothetical protein F4W70_26775 [Pseudomonas cannabina]
MYIQIYSEVIVQNDTACKQMFVAFGFPESVSIGEPHWFLVFVAKHIVEVMGTVGSALKERHHCLFAGFSGIEGGWTLAWGAKQDLHSEVCNGFRYTGPLFFQFRLGKNMHRQGGVNDESWWVRYGEL